MIFPEKQKKQLLESSLSEAITARDVSMDYGVLTAQDRVLKGVNLSVVKESIQLLMGPSGSGKTMLLLILAGLLTPTAGEVRLLGQLLTQMSRRQLEQFRLRYIGFIAQDFNLFPALTAAENINLVLHYKGVKGHAAKHQTQILLNQVGLVNKANFLPHQLSGGQKQRVAIARALVANPALIMADEPTASLDADHGYEIVTLLHELTRQTGRTVLIVTHDHRIVDIADQILHLENGKVYRA